MDRVKIFSFILIFYFFFIPTNYAHDLSSYKTHANTENQGNIEPLSPGVYCLFGKFENTPELDSLLQVFGLDNAGIAEAKQYGVSISLEFRDSGWNKSILHRIKIYINDFDKARYYLQDIMDFWNIDPSFKKSRKQMKGSLLRDSKKFKEITSRLEPSTYEIDLEWDKKGKKLESMELETTWNEEVVHDQALCFKCLNKKPKKVYDFPVPGQEKHTGPLNRSILNLVNRHIHASTNGIKYILSAV